MYIDKLDDIAKRYDSTNHSTIRMKPFNVKSSGYISSTKEINDQDPKVNLIILLEYQSIKTFLQKSMLQICLEKILSLKKLKTLCRGHMLLVILKVKKLLERFTKKNCKKQIKKSLESKKVIQKNVINYTLNGKAAIVLLTI